MNYFAGGVVLSVALATAPVMAHHAAADMVDEDVYEMIDDLVSDVHAEMTIDDLAYQTMMTIDTQSVRSMENMIDDGLLDYASMLDGEVAVEIEFNPDGSATMVISQSI
jgi:hypothetical protein